MSVALTCPVWLGPLLMSAIGCLPSAWANTHPLIMARLCGTSAWLALGLGLISAAGQLPRSTSTELGLMGFDFYVDALSVCLFVLVALLAAVVIRFSRNYLDGDPQQGYFLKLLALTSASVLTLTIAGHLVLFVIAWIATSLSLHRLLTFYPERPAAQLAARKKFLISRVGDLCLVAAMVLIYHAFGSLRFGAIFEAAEVLYLADVDAALSWGGPALPWISFLLLTGALLKSAQFPFHSWLPEVMETPTPVSALMHAGIINAGGFLVIRMSHVLVLTPSALHLLAVCGMVTALFGSVVMLTQTSIKKSLAYSTVAQMGFMMLQCGLGAFSSAFLHIVAHSLYKAHAFLSSGSIVDIARARWIPTAHKDPHPLQLAAAIAVALPITLLIGLAFGVTLIDEPGTLALGIVLQTALAYLLWNAFDGRFTLSIAAMGVVMSAAVGFAYFLLQALFARLLDGVVPTALPEAGPFDQIMAVTLSVLFMALLLLQTRFPDRRSNRNWQAAYVHCLNGFYLSTLANRAIQHCWPVRVTDRHPN